MRLVAAAALCAAALCMPAQAQPNVLVLTGDFEYVTGTDCQPLCDTAWFSVSGTRTGTIEVRYGHWEPGGANCGLNTQFDGEFNGVLNGDFVLQRLGTIGFGSTSGDTMALIQGTLVTVEQPVPCNTRITVHAVIELAGI